MRAADVTKRLLDARAVGNGALAKKPPRIDANPCGDTENGGSVGVDAVDVSTITWTPMPVSDLPETVRELAEHGAKALAVDSSLLAMPALAVCASAIGTTRALVLRRSWWVYPILWMAIVLRSGARKSPAHDLALDPLYRLQSERLSEYQQQMERHEAELLAYSAAVRDWQRGKAGMRGDPPPKPEEPVPTRYVTSDCTIEALASLIQSNPRGVLEAADELAAFFQSFDAYKTRGGGDAAKWLQLHRAGTLIVDRRHGSPRTLHVPRASVSITGTIQPGMLERILTPQYFAMGLPARFCFASPPEQPRRYVEADVPERVNVRYTELLRRLHALDFGTDQKGDPAPMLVGLSPEVKDLWVDWCNTSGAEIDATLDDDLRAALSKIEELPARLALVDHCIECVSDPQHPIDVLQPQSMRRGIALAQWFSRATQAVYAGLREPEAAREARKLLAWVVGQGGRCTPRDLVRRIWRYRADTDGARAALDTLVKMGLGEWTYPSGPGRSTAVFQVHRRIDIDETLGDGPENVGFVESKGEKPTIGRTVLEPHDVMPEDCRGDDPPADFCYGT